MRIVIADDHHLMRRGIRDLVTDAGCTVVGEASDGREAASLIAQRQPDIAILDHSMPALTGPEVTTVVARTSPATRVIILTMHDSEATLRQIVACGASGYVLKSEAETSLQNAIQYVAAGQRYYHSGAMEMMRTGYLQRAQERPLIDALTQREREIVAFLTTGLSSKQIAARLDISTRTVESHRLNIYRKLQLGTIADLVHYAIRESILPTASGLGTAMPPRVAAREGGVA